MTWTCEACAREHPADAPGCIDCLRAEWLLDEPTPAHVDFAFPSSPNADKLKRPAGCYVISATEDGRLLRGPFDAVELAREALTADPTLAASWLEEQSVAREYMR